MHQNACVHAVRRTSSYSQLQSAGVNRRGSWLAGPELAGSRTIRPRSSYLGAPTASSFRPLSRRVPDSLLATISQSASASPLNPDVWERVLEEALAHHRLEEVHDDFPLPERVEEFSIQQLVPHCPVDAIAWRGETGTIRPAIVIVRKIRRGRTRSDATLFGRESNR